MWSIISSYCSIQFELSFLSSASRRALGTGGRLKRAANSLIPSLFRDWVCDSSRWALTAMPNREWQKRHCASFQFQTLRNQQFLYLFCWNATSGSSQTLWKKSNSPGTNIFQTMCCVSALVNSPTGEQLSSQRRWPVTEAALDFPD